MKRFSNILLVLDERTDYSAALNRGVTLARKNQANLTVCAIVDKVPGDMTMGIIAIKPSEVLDIAASEKRNWLENTVTSVAADGVSLSTKVLIGRPFLEMIRQVLRDDHDLIIKCAEVDSGLAEMLFSSTDMHLMRKCPCPIWIIKPTEHHQYRRILAAVDQDPEEPAKNVLNRQILEMSTSLARAEDGEVHVAHAWDVFDEKLLKSHSWGFSEAEFDAMVEEEAAARRDWLKDVIKSCGISADENTAGIPADQIHVIKGQAQYVVPDLARDLAVDLVVMGTVARTGVAGLFMGSTAETILTQLDCSVLTIKPPGFTSPVTLDA